MRDILIGPSKAPDNRWNGCVRPPDKPKKDKKDKGKGKKK